MSKPKLRTYDLKSMKIQKLQKIMQEEVFENEDFIRHLEETSIKTGFPVSVIKTVVEDYFSRIGTEMIKVKKHKRRFVLFGFMNLEIFESKYNPFSIYFKQKRYAIPRNEWLKSKYKPKSE
jgi:hypothetical protein